MGSRGGGGGGGGTRGSSLPGRWGTGRGGSRAGWGGGGEALMGYK